MTDETAALDRRRRQTSVSFALTLLLAAAVINVGTVLLVRGHSTVAGIDSDEQEYWSLASGLLNDGIGSVPARRTVPFPLILASLRAILGNSYLPVQVALSAVLALIPFVAYLLVRAHFGNERVARLTGLGILFWPPFIRYAATLYSDSIAVLGFLCFLAALSAAMRRETEFSRMRSASWLFAGALLGVCIQLKPLYLVYVPIGAALAFAAERQGPRGAAPRRTIAVLLLMTGTIAALAPSSVYLSKREGHFMLVTGNDSETLAGGLNPALLTTHAVYLTGDRRQTWVGPGKWLDAAATGYLTPEELRRPYIEKRVLLRERSVAWIRSHPAAVAYLTIRKILYMWGLYPFWNGASQTLLGNCLLIPLMAAAVVSTVRLRRRAHDTALFWTLPLFSTLVACISWGSWRFRMPGDVGLIVLAAALTLTPEGEWHRGGEPPPSPAAAETA